MDGLSSNRSEADFRSWEDGGCQPNFWAATANSDSCGPWSPLAASAPSADPPLRRPALSVAEHDTISALAVDGQGYLAAATSTNGLSHKIAGRVGDAAVPGAGHYALRGVGACGATGDGDLMMRFLPCYQAVESLRLGTAPAAAAEDALGRVAAFFPDFQGALVVLTADGRHAGAAYNWVFHYSVADAEGSAVVTVQPMQQPRRGAAGLLAAQVASHRLHHGTTTWGSCLALGLRLAADSARLLCQPGAASAATAFIAGAAFGAVAAAAAFFGRGKDTSCPRTDW